MVAILNSRRTIFPEHLIISENQSHRTKAGKNPYSFIICIPFYKHNNKMAANQTFYSLLIDAVFCIVFGIVSQWAECKR